MNAKLNEVSLGLLTQEILDLMLVQIPPLVGKINLKSPSCISLGGRKSKIPNLKSKISKIFPA
ncbi:hypothetical protein NIES2119_24260 [[Phormidium ambiguum] IAM M-71]|uniref:Uncharacterized protein n=1 Tax=[Phormidium ambiguum] IAM M-71 TaxID=454136 RepID=A0A1U7I9B6_9CYAN|nr:hypothetical protein NIES2119_24260 [Phormidium ambiguum IAM M-71]